MLQLLNWMLAIACQQGHLDIAKLLVLTYKADPDSYALRKNEFAALTRLPLYAAMKAGTVCECGICGLLSLLKTSHSHVGAKVEKVGVSGCKMAPFPIPHCI